MDNSAVRGGRKKISRRMVYKLVAKYKKEVTEAYKSKKVAEIRESTDYGSEKPYFVLKKSGAGVSQHIIQRI